MIDLLPTRANGAAAPPFAKVTALACSIIAAGLLATSLVMETAAGPTRQLSTTATHR